MNFNKCIGQKFFEPENLVMHLICSTLATGIACVMVPKDHRFVGCEIYYSGFQGHI